MLKMFSTRNIVFACVKLLQILSAILSLWIAVLARHKLTTQHNLLSQWKCYQPCNHNHHFNITVCERVNRMQHWFTVHVTLSWLLLFGLDTLSSVSCTCELEYNTVYLWWQLTLTTMPPPSGRLCCTSRVAFSPVLAPSMADRHWVNHSVSYCSRAVARRLYSLHTRRDSWGRSVILWYIQCYIYIPNRNTVPHSTTLIGLIIIK